MADRKHINLYQLANRSEVDQKIVGDIFDVILACMEEGVEVRVRGFGKFKPVIVPERTVISPVVPGGQSLVGRHRTVKFTLAKSVKREWTIEPKAEGEDE